MKIPSKDDDRVLRHVDCDGYRLLMWDTYRFGAYGKSILGYAFYAPSASEPLFSGEDFECSPMRAIDSDEALRSLLGFLTLRPGDTDAEYFAEYTPEQMAFAEGPAEGLQLFTMDENTIPFWDLDTCHECGRDMAEGSGGCERCDVAEV